MSYQPATVSATARKARTAPVAVGRHPLVQAACRVEGSSGSVLSRASRISGDPDQMVVLSCLASFLVLPFIL